jgi:hypothetical protein
MSIISLFTKKSPTFSVGGSIISFDAVLEDTLEAEVTYPVFPLEIGANATDHGIIQPIRWTLTAAVSNNPLNLGVVEASAFVANLFDSAALTAIGGLSAGLLGGSKQTRAGATLEALLGLMFARAPFDIDAVDIQLENMVITNIARTKTPENEQGIEFVAELMELPLISTVISTNQPAQDQLREGDPAKTQAAADVSKGEVGTKETSIADAVSAGLIL